MKKLFLLVLLFISGTFLSSVVVNADYQANVYGFEIEDEGLISLSNGWTTFQTEEVCAYHLGVTYVIGYTTTFIGRYQIDPDELTSGLDTFVVMVRVISEGNDTDIPGSNRYIFGLTDDVIIESDIDSYPYPIENNLASYSPNTVPTSSSYTLGFILGTSISITASETFNVNDIDVINHSSTANRHFGVEYDYNLERWFFDKTTFRSETDNFAIYIIEVPDGYLFHNKTHIYSRYSFKEDTVMNYWDSINNSDYYGIKHSDYFY
ncbi:MAG: hypothetical protein WC152_06705 [Candidatus Izemoplasmatales bacterium]